MSDYSIDVTYAYAQLGLAVGASPADIAGVLANARNYRFYTRARVAHVEKFCEFFSARARLGALTEQFAEIRKAYHQKAMALHPDRNANNRAAEDELKAINAAFALVEDIHREARDHFKLNEEQRRTIEQEAREATERERPAEQAQEHAKENAPPKPEQPKAQTTPTGSHLYFAASIPRSVRSARLSHLPVGYIIGSWHIEVKNDLNQVFDVIMLPEKEFNRARMYLGAPTVVDPSLSRGGVTPPYVPKDTKQVVVPEGEADPRAFAKEYFLREFNLLPRMR